MTNRQLLTNRIQTAVNGPYFNYLLLVGPERPIVPFLTFNWEPKDPIAHYSLCLAMRENAPIILSKMLDISEGEVGPIKVELSCGLGKDEREYVLKFIRFDVEVAVQWYFYIDPQNPGYVHEFSFCGANMTSYLAVIHAKIFGDPPSVPAPTRPTWKDFVFGELGAPKTFSQFLHQTLCE